MAIARNAHPLSMSSRKNIRGEALWGYLFIAPTVLGLGIFYIGPAIAAFGFSLTEWNGITQPLYIGLQNYFNLFTDQKFIRSLVNTVLFSLGSVPLSIILATLAASLLNRKMRGTLAYRTLFFIPVVTMPVAVGIVWRWLYNSQYGIINYFLGLLHFPQPAWILDESTALISIIIVSIWMTVGYNMVILLAGLQNIPQSYYEYSTLEGASRTRTFFSITLPLLTPSLFFVFVLSTIKSFQIFDLIFVMTENKINLLGPIRTIVYGIWEQGFTFYKMGYASAQAVILFLIIFILTIFQMILQKKWVYYS